MSLKSWHITGHVLFSNKVLGPKFENFYGAYVSPKLCSDQFPIDDIEQEVEKGIHTRGRVAHFRTEEALRFLRQWPQDESLSNDGARPVKGIVLHAHMRRIFDSPVSRCLGRDSPLKKFDVLLC